MKNVLDLLFVMTVFSSKKYLGVIFFSTILKVNKFNKSCAYNVVTRKETDEK